MVLCTVQRTRCARLPETKFANLYMRRRRLQRQTHAHRVSLSCRSRFSRVSERSKCFNNALRRGGVARGKTCLPPWFVRCFRPSPSPTIRTLFRTHWCALRGRDACFALSSCWCVSFYFIFAICKFAFRSPPTHRRILIFPACV